ncbi:MAG: class I SAM-dependent methyltransferase [Bacteroidota bacterium]
METLESGSFKLLSLLQKHRSAEGILGKDLGHLLYDGNKNMFQDSLDLLNIRKKNRILEIWPGHCAHLPQVMEQASGLRYFGLDLSKTMIENAKRINGISVSGRKALFRSHDGVNVPYVNDFFDRIVTINTIYLWQHPTRFLNEIYRVLKPGGICVITFVNANSMKGLNLQAEAFNLFDIPKFLRLVSETPFKHIDIQTRNELEKTEKSKPKDREFLVATLMKSNTNAQIEI